jgi:RNA polymerase sigma-70 factor (ECF subfamily)
MDDAELVRLVLRGDGAAYTELVKRYTTQIAALCRARVLRPEVVDDLVQETFLRGLDRLPRLRDPGRFGPWLYAIARNLCRDWLNDPHNGYLPLDAAAPALVAPASAGRPDRTADVMRCVDRLPVELREVLVIYYVSGRMTYQELANRLGVSFCQVNRMLTQARRILRGYLRGDTTT